MPDYSHPEKRLGGGLEASGGITIVANSLFRGNNKQAFVALYYGNNYLVNCTFVDNSLEQMAGAVWASDSKLFVYNCINYNNGDYPLGVGNVEELNRSRLEVYYSLLENGEESVTVNNEEWCDYYYDDSNIEGDPLFLGGDYNPYNLSESSPCIDAGTLDLPGFINLPDVDLAGNPRVTNGAIDMGAYEWNPNVGVPEFLGYRSSDSINLSPNPVSDYLNIKLLREPATVSEGAFGRLTDIHGNIQDEIKMQQPNCNYILPVYNYPAGTYIFQYDNGKGTLFSKKLIITK